MKNHELTSYRNELNKVMAEADLFFKELGLLDNKAYEDGALSKKNKKVIGLAISVTTKRNECILYHLNGCIDTKATKNEIVEAIKIGAIAGRSITYPNARFVFEMLKELNIL
jgi:AhpD family alkylhydroperoxidase